MYMYMDFRSFALDKLATMPFQHAVAIPRKPVDDSAMNEEIQSEMQSAAQPVVTQSPRSDGEWTIEKNPKSSDSSIARHDNDNDNASIPQQTILRSIANWKWELLCALIGTISFSAITVILRVNEAKVLSRWKGGLSINAFVSILAALFKGSLAVPLSNGIGQLKWIWLSKKERRLADLSRFDRASTGGAWGSIALVGVQLSSQKMSKLAVFGAMIIILSLATDPFFQATVSIQSCEAVDSQPATTVRIVTAFSDVLGTGPGVGSQYLSTDMQMAYYSGIYKPPANTSMVIDATCPTGNCTFISFNTLSMCHACSDISDELQHNTANETWHLPRSNLTLVKDLDHKTNPLHAWIQTATSAIYTNTTYNPNDSQDVTFLADFQLLALACKDNTSAQISDTDCNSGALAVGCSFTPCVKTYSASVTNHVYSEVEDQAARQYLYPFSLQTLYAKGFQVAVNRTFANNTWIDCDSSPTSTDTHTVSVYDPGSYAESLDRDNYTTYHPTPNFYRPECVFALTEPETTALKHFTDDIFHAAQVLVPYKGRWIGEAWLQRIWGLGSVTLPVVDTFAHGIATMISAQWRTRSDDPRTETPLGRSNPHELVYGQSYSLLPCIHVRWPFLAFPAIVLVATLLFLLLVLLISHRSSWYGDWKASTVPHLFQNLNIPVDDSKQSEKELYHRATEYKASFSQIGGRWSLSAH